MPAHTINLADAQSVLRILLTLVEEGGGELRFKCANYDAMEKGKLLILDRDAKKGQIVIRATTDYGTVVQVAPEAHTWTMPPDVAPRERARVAAEAEAHLRNAPTDEALADLEEKINRSQKLARDVEDGKSPVRISLRK